jgi:ankyrin repeat protein
MKTKENMLNRRLKSDWTNKYYLCPCFIGTMSEVITDMYPKDYSYPENINSDDLTSFVFGPISTAWIQDNAGRQMIGSFHPITEGDWANGAQILGYAIEMSSAVVMDEVQQLETIFNSKFAEISSTSPEEENLVGLLANVRDALGRTLLHIAIMSQAVQSVNFLLEHGADISVRLPDGRDCLHLGAQYGNIPIFQKILEKLNQTIGNQQSQEKNKEREKKKTKLHYRPTQEQLQAQFDLNRCDYDNNLSPLHYAIILGYPEIVKLVFAAGAQVNHVVLKTQRNQHRSSKSQECQTIQMLLLALHLAEWDENLQETMIQILLSNGANSACLNEKNDTVLHILVESPCPSRLLMLKKLLVVDPSLDRQNVLPMNLINGKLSGQFIEGKKYF